MSYSGPFLREQTLVWPDSFAGARQYKSVQEVYKTNPGSLRDPLPYAHTLSFYENRVVWSPGGGHVEPPDCYQIESAIHPEGRMYTDFYGLNGRARNRARTKFISELNQKQQASIGAALGEWHQSFSMIAERLKTLYDAYSALKKGNWRKAARALSAPPPRTPKGMRGQAKQAASLWLEWHFGWTPLLQDIHGAMDALSSPLPLIQNIHVSSRAQYDQSLTTVFENGTLKTELAGSFHAVSRIQGTARLVNPSLGLLSQLGLVNPASVAWELVPFSFLVDHVIGIGDFIDSFTDTLSWNLNEVTVTSYDFLENGFFKNLAGGGGTGDYTRGDWVNAEAFTITRSKPSLSLPPYLLEFTNPFRDISVSRAATYCALLLQAMS